MKNVAPYLHMKVPMKKLEAVKARMERRIEEAKDLRMALDIDDLDRAYLLKLEKYVRHRETCPDDGGRRDSDNPNCTCGLTALLEQEDGD